jgi:hypothetical protein
MGVLCREKVKESMENGGWHNMDEEGNYLVTSCQCGC